MNICLIRNTSSIKKDDTIVVRPTDIDGTVYLRYQDSVNRSKHELYLTHEQLSHYFVSLFHAMSYDTEPFDSVQVNFPAFPCILLSVKDLGYESLRMRLQSMIHFTLSTSYADGEGEDDEDEDEEDGEYDDMPPLVRARAACECECDVY